MVSRAVPRLHLALLPGAARCDLEIFYRGLERKQRVPNADGQDCQQFFGGAANSRAAGRTPQDREVMSPVSVAELLSC